MILGHRMRVLILATLLALLALMLFANRTHAGWSVDPVEVHPTTALCPLVSVAHDGAQGALITWQENMPAGGFLWARHLLANGDLDAGWSTPVLLSSAGAVRGALGSLSDGAGGAYVWWMEGTQLYLTRLAAEGAVAAGWPAQGRLLGVLVNASSRPVAVPDGDGGLYIAWLASVGLIPTYVAIRAHHLGPTNTPEDGWPSGGRTLAGTQANSESVSAFGIAAATDGGLWLTHGTTLVVEEGVFAPGEVRVARYTGAGLPATGWITEGVSLAEFRGDLLAADANWGLAPPMRLAAVAPDASGGAFVLFSSIVQADWAPLASHHLLRVSAAGGVEAGWPAEGVPVPLIGLEPHSGENPDHSLRLHAGPSGGVYVGRPTLYDHGASYNFDLFSDGGVNLGLGVGSGLAGSIASGDRGLESALRADGGLVLASFFPHGPIGPWQPSAFIQMNQTAPGASFTEAHPEPFTPWFGDVGLATTGDGGTIFAWSQVNERYGVFAVRMNPDGQVLGVPPLTLTGPLRVRFTRGVGVQVLGGTVGVSLTLHDLSGRKVAHGEADFAGEWTVPGTAGLPSGIYFARTLDHGSERQSKVVVIR